MHQDELNKHALTISKNFMRYFMDYHDKEILKGKTSITGKDFDDFLKLVSLSVAESAVVFIAIAAREDIIDMQTGQRIIDGIYRAMSIGFEAMAKYH